MQFSKKHNFSGTPFIISFPGSPLFIELVFWAEDSFPGIELALTGNVDLWDESNAILRSNSKFHLLTANLAPSGTHALYATGDKYVGVPIKITSFGCRVSEEMNMGNVCIV